MTGTSKSHQIEELKTEIETLRRELDEDKSAEQKLARIVDLANRWTNRALTDETGTVQEILAIGHDITANRKVEDELKIGQNILQAVIANIGAGFVVSDNDGNILSMNESALRMHGFKNETDMFSRLDQYTSEFELQNPDGEKLDPLQWPLALALRGEFIKDYEVRLLRNKSESHRIISYNTVPVCGNDGRQILIVITMTDLTEITERNEDLKKSQQRYNSLFNNSTLGIVHCRIITGQDGKPSDYQILQVNDAYTRIRGLKKEDIEGKTAREVFPDIENFPYDYLGNYGKIALEGGELNFETYFEPIDQWLSVYVYSPEKREFTAIFSDITERKKVEEEVKARAIEIEAILSCIANGVVVYDGEGRVKRTNDAANKMLNFRENEKGLTLSERVPRRYNVWSEDGKLLKLEEMPAYRASAKSETIRNELYKIEVDGETHWFSISAAPLMVSGKRRGGVLSLSDITARKRSEEALRKNEQRLQGVFSNVAIGILEVDSDDRIFSVNNRSCEILAYSAPELLGKTVSEITAPEDRSLSDDMNARLHKGEFDVFDYEKRYLKRNGTSIWVHVTVSAVRNAQGHHLSSIGTIEDISERKKVEEELLESRQRLQGIFDNAAIGIVEVNAEDRFIAVNNRMCDILGYSREEFYKMAVHDITAPEDLPHSNEMNLKLHEGELNMFDYEKRYIKKDGSKIWVHVSVSAVRDAYGQHIRTIRTVEDISDKKKNEIEIRQKNEELTRFIYTVSHDLKSPLVTIKSFTSYLKENIENNDKEAQDKDIGYIQNAADKMGRLLDELLELSRIGRKEKSKTRTLLKEIAQSALDLVAGRMDEKKIRVQFSGPQIMLYGHAQRLVQLYQNLLDNAAKFMGNQPDPMVEIGSYPDKEKPGDIVLYVRDNGSGIDPRHHHKLFGLFEKLDNSVEGTGIGLALVKRIAEVHGGSVWFTSEGTGKGTTFYFKLEGTEIIK